MTSTTTSHSKNLAAFIHLSTFAKYFIPLGNFILPLILWTIKRKESSLVDQHGRQAINFQISMFLYNMILILLALPVLGWQVFSLVRVNTTMNLEHDYSGILNMMHASGLLFSCIILGVLFLILFIVELISVINAANHASKGRAYRYPVCIPFLGNTIQQNKHNTQA